MNSLLQYLVRGIGLMASLGLFLLTLVVTAYAFIEGGLVVAEILQSSDPEYSVIYNAMKVVDLFLLGFSILIASVGRAVTILRRRCPTHGRLRCHRFELELRSYRRP
jgi:hypothetical protein